MSGLFSLATVPAGRKDDLVLEVALAGGAEFIVTHNILDFGGVDTLGIQAVTPDRFLSILASR